MFNIYSSLLFFFFLIWQNFNLWHLLIHNNYSLLSSQFTKWFWYRLGLSSISYSTIKDFTNWTNCIPLTHHFIDCKDKLSLNLLIHNYKSVPSTRLITHLMSSCNCNIQQELVNIFRLAVPSAHHYHVRKRTTWS